ncbi:MAG: aminodeoxychorismate/anthranilate synthase component II [Bacteroidota bacterium]
MKILVIDNYDSFVYNLVYLLREVGAPDVTVIKNDRILPGDAERYDKILLSPGPGVPRDAGMMPEIIRKYAPVKSMLGICLGHQAIAEVFGGCLHNLPEPLHGVSSKIEVHSQDYLFRNLPRTFQIAHYHSWVVEKPLPDVLECTAASYGNIMAIRHRSYDVRGLQFHPESIMTEYGKQMIENWIKNQEYEGNT